MGISPSLFDDLVQDGTLPKSFKLRNCTLWDMRALDAAIDAFAGDAGRVNSWDDWLDNPRPAKGWNLG